MTPLVRKLVPARAKALWHRYQDSAFKWRFVDNLRPTLEHYLRPLPASGEAARVVHELHGNGVAMTSIAALLGGTSTFDELGVALRRLEEDQRESIEQARHNAAADLGGHKSYLHMFIGDRAARLEGSHPFIVFAQQPALRAIAEGYFQMRPYLRQVDVWYNFATAGSPRASQYWHRDREDRHILKMFVYLDDVADSTGPLTYARGTHSDRTVRPESFREPGHGNPRTTNEQMAKVVPETAWFRAIGAKGSIVLADTAGYHRGGDVERGERRVFTCMFTSSACDEPLLTIV